MALLVYNSAPAAADIGSTTKLLSNSSLPRRSSLSFSLVPLSHCRRNAHIVRARKGLASRTRRLEKRGRDRGGATTEAEEEGLGAEKKGENRGSSIDLEGGDGSGREGGELVYSKGPPPVLPGEKPDFWEGPQWDALGFFVQYMWAFGIVFGAIACGFAVATYNEGATDFKETPVYTESIQSRELLEQPDSSSTDVFEVNPTEVAPSLE